MAFLFFIVLILSIITIVKPEVAWYLSTGWKLRDAEPSDLALTMNRLSGVFLSVISVIVIISNISDASEANNWPKNFVNQLSVETVDTMTVHFSKYLSTEEKEEVIEILREVNFTKGERKSSFGCTTQLEVVFTYGDRETIYCWGDKFWISPNGIDYRYNFISPELKLLIDDIMKSE